jgi:hypothetical protein
MDSYVLKNNSKFNFQVLLTLKATKYHIDLMMIRYMLAIQKAILMSKAIIIIGYVIFINRTIKSILLIL